MIYWRAATRHYAARKSNNGNRLCPPAGALPGPETLYVEITCTLNLPTNLEDDRAPARTAGIFPVRFPDLIQREDRLDWHG